MQRKHEHASIGGPVLAWRTLLLGASAGTRRTATAVPPPTWLAKTSRPTRRLGIAAMRDNHCRFCGNRLTENFADLGMSPLSNAFIAPENAQRMEPFYPLHAFVCQKCFLVQLDEFESPEHIFEDYLYFSSFSEGWLRHAA